MIFKVTKPTISIALAAALAATLQAEPATPTPTIRDVDDPAGAAGDASDAAAAVATDASPQAPVATEPELSGAPDFSDRPDPIASENAVPGGSITYAAAAAPKSLNPYLDNNTFSYQVFGSLYESLLSSDPLTGDNAPGLARKWEVSEDKREFTFYLNPLARWSDGKPVTARDVLWTFNAVMSPSNQTGAAKVALQTFAATPPEIIDDLTIKFTADEVHWRNLNAAGGFEIMPEHVFAGRDFNKTGSDFPVVSGPYRIAAFKEGVSLTLERRTNWWGRALDSSRGLYNFQRVTYRFFAEQDNAFDAFLAGEVDVFPVYRAAIWVNRTSGRKFDNNWIVKRRVANHHPVGFQGFAMNLRRAPFDDLRVRMAFAKLLDRRRLNETLMFNQYFLQRSYWENLYDASNECHNVSIDFDPAGAAALLDEAGWTLDPATGVRTNGARRLSFTFLTRDETSDKFLALYREDLRKAGVEMKIERKDWAAWTRDMDAFDFDMTWAAWSGGVNIDPEGMWASAEADREGGNNITGFKDAMVDKLIEAQREIFDLSERNEICRRIDGILTEQVPYILLWNVDSTRLLYWDKFGTPPTVLSKFGDERSLLAYWWYDEDSATDLAEAMETGDILPARPDIVEFDSAFIRN